jgi:thiol:disulfide interchange protein DsbD
VTATVQGCAEIQGVCFPPLARDYSLTLPGAAKAAATPVAESVPSVAAPVPPQPLSVTPPTVAAALPVTAAVPAGDDSQAANLLRQGSFGLIVAGFFGFGLLLALTPCVFPMIPILSGIIVGEGHQVTKTRGFVLSLIYVLGMALTYAVAGVAAGLSGALLSNALQNPWVLSGFALVFVALAFSMFGFYELQMPSFIQSRLTNSSNRLKGGSLAGVFIMGVLSGLIVGPCVAAPLAGALLYIGQTGDTVLGGTALFAMALGMGAPLLLIGLSAGALLPKAGAWMQAVKNFFGVLLLGVAIWLVSPVIPSLAHMLAWAALLTVSAIYMHALDPLPVNAGGFAKFWKGVGVIALVCGLALLVGALSGSRDILQPLAGLRTAAAGPAQAPASGLKFEKVASVAELDAKIPQLKGKYVMLKFYAEWCVSCKEFERFTLGDARVQAKLADMGLLVADVTDYNAEHKALLKRFDLFGPPGILFYDPEGKLVLRLVGEEGPDKFLVTLARLRGNG